MRTTYKKEKIKDLEKSYGKDIENELTSILSEQLAREIDREVLRGLGIEPDRNKRRKKSIEKIFKLFQGI